MNYPNPISQLEDIEFISVKTLYEKLWQGNTPEVCSTLREIQKSPLEINYIPYYILLGLDREDFLRHQILKFIVDKRIITLILRNEGGFRQNNLNYESFLNLMRRKAFETLDEQEKKERQTREEDKSLSSEELDEKYDYIKIKLEQIIQKLSNIIIRIKEKHEGKFPKKD